MQGAWTAFARDPVNGLTKHGWPMYDVTKPTLIELGKDNHTTADFAKGDAYDAACLPGVG